jgi:hypothetical protein
MGSHLDTTTNGEKDWRSAGLRHGGPAKVSCKGAVPVVVSRRPLAIGRLANRLPGRSLNPNVA